MEHPQRMHARYPCRLKVRLRVPGGEECEGEMTDLGMGGALVRCGRLLRGSELELLIPFEQGTALIRARLARRSEEKGAWLYGLALDPHFSERPKLAAVVDKLRRG